MNKTPKKIMLVGYGSAAQYELDFLVRNPSLQNCEFIVASRGTKEEVEARLNTTIISAGLMDYYPKVRYVQMDLQNHEQMVKVLKEINPDIITYTGRFIPGIKYGHYSYPNQIGYGAWIALAVPLIYNLCKALEASGCKAKVINSSFPDGVCPWLRSAGYTQVITGAGNINHVVPRLKLAICDYYKCEIKDITQFKLVGSHYLNTYVSKEGNPRGSRYYLTFRVKGKKYEYLDEGAEYLFEKCKIPMESGQVRNLMIASDIANLVDMMVVTGHSKEVHVPGPYGRIGGYPTKCQKCGNKGVVFSILGKIDDIGVYRTINEQSLSLDGIEDIHDGIVVFTDEVIKKMKDVFDIQYPKELRIEDAEKFAYEIKSAILIYEAKGVFKWLKSKLKKFIKRK